MYSCNNTFWTLFKKDLKHMHMTMRLKHVLKFKSILNALMHWSFKQYVFIAFGICAREHSL